MPIYAYKCADCGHQAEVLQKISDAPLTDCPACGRPSMAKQVTAAGFQLKGSGWYATDFRDKGTAAKPEKTDSKTESANDAKVDAKADTKTDTKTDTKADTKKTDAKADPPAPKKDAPAARGQACGTGGSAS